MTFIYTCCPIEIQDVPYKSDPLSIKLNFTHSINKQLRNLSHLNGFSEKSQLQLAHDDGVFNDPSERFSEAKMNHQQGQEERRPLPFAGVTCESDLQMYQKHTHTKVPPQNYCKI